MNRERALEPVNTVLVTVLLFTGCIVTPRNASSAVRSAVNTYYHSLVKNFIKWWLRPWHIEMSPKASVPFLPK